VFGIRVYTKLMHMKLIILSECHHCVAVGGQGKGKILQRFPEKDWDNCPFTQGIELVSLENVAALYNI